MYKCCRFSGISSCRPNAIASVSSGKSFVNAAICSCTPSQTTRTCAIWTGWCPSSWLCTRRFDCTSNNEFRINIERKLKKKIEGGPECGAGWPGALRRSAVPRHGWEVEHSAGCVLLLNGPNHNWWVLMNAPHSRRRRPNFAVVKRLFAQRVVSQ